jgi:hypothetical protein
VVEQRGDEWIAEFQVPNTLAGEVVPTADAAVILPDHSVTLSVNGPDRRIAMLRLTDLVASAG